MERMKTVTTPELLVRAAPGSLPRITITTDAVDAMRDRVLQGGLTFRTPLSVLSTHDYRALPVGQSTRDMIARLPHRTEAQWRWLEGDERATQVRNALEQGFLGASVGMQVHDATPNDVGGYDITRAEVIEFSLTAVPANPECVRLLKDLGWGTGRGQREEEAEDVVVRCLDDGAGADPMVVHLAEAPPPGMTVEEVRALITTTGRAMFNSRRADAGRERVDAEEAAQIIRAELYPIIEATVRGALLHARGRVD